jgi:hypothetical protein
MKLSIQDPNWPDSVYMLEAILEAAEGALSGAAVYAFASAGGAKLVVGDKGFQQFLARGRFDLVVGVDAVTNGAALDILQAATAEFPNLNVRVFLDEASGGLFHPKMCWFRRTRSSQCLIGSSNLTVGGLRGNCEVFASTVLEGLSRRTFEAKWSAWLAFSSVRLFPTDDARVRARAVANTGIEGPTAGRQTADVIVEDPEGNILVGPGRSETNAVLIAEIPRSGDRWNQANFDVNNFQNFFGATLGRTQRIILNHIASNGRVGREEVRPSVSVRSRNYRFELDAASGLAYPDRGRPIAVFLRTATRTFRYHLLMPGTREYNRVRNYLRNHSQMLGNHVFRLPTTVGELIRNDFPRRTLNLLVANIDLQNE